MNRRSFFGLFPAVAVVPALARKEPIASAITINRECALQRQDLTKKHVELATHAMIYCGLILPGELPSNADMKFIRAQIRPGDTALDLALRITSAYRRKAPWL